jgi:voltage-dependent calcium channel R type alpha-1E
MAFMIIGSLFMLNLFVSIVVNTYYGEKEKLFKNEHLSKYQKLWLQIQSMCFEEEPVKVEILGGNALQRICIGMARENSWFDYTILGCIILNTIFMSISWYESPASLDKPFEYLNYFFTAVFTMEAIIKLIAFGFANYFNKGWNIFDFAIIVISYVTLIIG